jgi:hypothetical protein
LILRVGILAVITLVGTRALLVAYFDRMATAEQSRKIVGAKPEALISLRADETQRLGSGSMPIEQAMQRLAAQGRMAASPDIMPSASRDIAALQGWQRMPGDVPAAMAAPPISPGPVVDAGMTAVMEAGAAAAADAATKSGKASNPKTPKKKP